MGGTYGCRTLGRSVVSERCGDDRLGWRRGARVAWAGRGESFPFDLSPARYSMLSDGRVLCGRELVGENPTGVR